jgi:hypothetical protein
MNSKSNIVQALAPLVAVMKAKKEVGEPYVLCLGEGATLSSGCRDMRWAVRKTIGEKCPWVLDALLADLGRPERCDEDSSKFDELLRTLSEEQWYSPLRRKFFELLDLLKGAERSERLNVFLEEEYPSYGYSFLALLAREGFFDVIFNANYDPLLQNALERYLPFTDEQGRPVQRYQRLINRADPSFKRELEEALDSPIPRIKAIWLHGHLWEVSGIAFTPMVKRDWYTNVKDIIEKRFGQDLLLIGYTDRDIDILLALQNARDDGNVWYVAPEAPRADIDLALQARKHTIISGPAAEFDTFCQVLFDLTLDLDDPKKVQKDDTCRLELLQKKQEILAEYVRTIERRQQDDPMAPPTLQDQKDTIQYELMAIKEILESRQ